MAQSLSTILERLAKRLLREPNVKFRTLVEDAGLSPSVDFVGASLEGLDFRDDDLSGFNFSRANLTCADFRRATISDTKFDDAILLGAIGLDSRHVVVEAIGESPPADFDLAKVRDLIMRGLEVPPTWVPFVTELDLSLAPIRELHSLTNLHNLRCLDLTKTKITDIEPLQRLTGLQVLGLGDTAVEDISALRELKLLRSLDLTSTRVTNLSILSHIPSLEQLFLLNTPIRDARSITHFNGLTIIGSVSLLRSSIGERESASYVRQPNIPPPKS